MAESDLYNLEFLSLVAKITQEIDNHTGLNDKTLAEFVISLHDQSKTLPEFKSKLKEVGADFPESFVENMDRLILSMHPRHKKKFSTKGGKKNKNTNGISEADKKKRQFPGLALADQEPITSQDAIMKEVDDLMSQFEGAAKKSKARPADTERSPKRQRRDRSRSRSPSHRHRSPSPSRSHDYGSRYGDRRGRGRGPLDDKPVLYKIYNGKVSGLRDFGAFVTLEGVAGRAEGTSLWVIFDS